MIELIRHHLRRAQAGEQFNALRDCHVKGLHSIVLREEPHRVRVFYADLNHQLEWRGRLCDDMPLAIHSHHCDIRLDLLFGEVYSPIYRFSSWPGSLPLSICRFESAITGGGSLKPLRRKRRLRLHESFPLGTQHLKANEMHTVVVPERQEAAWLVTEGKEDPKYEPLCYTNMPKWSPKGLYQPVGPAVVAHWLGRIVERMQ